MLISCVIKLPLMGGCTIFEDKHHITFFRNTKIILKVKSTLKIASKVGIIVFATFFVTFCLFIGH